MTAKRMAGILPFMVVSMIDRYPVDCSTSVLKQDINRRIKMIITHALIRRIMIDLRIDGSFLFIRIRIYAPVVLLQEGDAP